jgi:hypothetical protein
MQAGRVYQAFRHAGMEAGRQAFRAEQADRQVRMQGGAIRQAGRQGRTGI